MARVGVVRDANGDIETLLSVRAAKRRDVKEFKDDRDAECQAFLNPPPPGVDDIVDATIANDVMLRGLVAMLAARLPGNPTVDELIADIKRLSQ